MVSKKCLLETEHILSKKLSGSYSPFSKISFQIIKFRAAV